MKSTDAADWAVFQAFMHKYPNINLQITGALEPQHDVALEAEAQSGTLPDFFEVGYPSLVETFYKGGDLLNLSPILQSTHLTSMFPPAERALDSYNNKQYAVPFQENAEGFYVNKTLFAKYHLTVPTTFSDLLADVKVFHSHNVVTIGQGFDTTNYANWGFYGMLDEYGLQNNLQAILSGKMPYGNANVLKFYANLQQLQQAGAFPPDQSTLSYFQALAGFQAGKYPLMNAGSWATPTVQTTSFAKNAGWWWGPSVSNGVTHKTVFIDVPTGAWVVAASVAKNPAVYSAISELVAFVYSDSAQQLRLTTGQALSTTTYAGTVAPSLNVLSSIVQAVHGPNLSQAPAEPDKEFSVAMANAYDNSVDGVMEGVLTPSAAAKMVQSTIPAS
jgi:raffinose/stachyose/melibiose transport system substrate-binding protein